MSYRNVNNFVVIAADNRDPHASFNSHRARGSLGGVDCVAVVGTPVYAPTDGVAYTGVAGTGGRTVTLAQVDGWRDQFMHLSRYAVTNGTRVSQFDLLGYSGRSGIDASGAIDDFAYDPHVHWHRIDPDGFHSDQWGTTNRRNPWDYFDNSSTGTGGLAGGGITVIVALDGNNDSADDKAIRAILQRSFKFHVRENETTGPTVWERFAAVLDAVGKVATLATKQDKRREEINQRNEDLHKALREQIAAGAPVTVKVDESFADLVAEKVAAKIPAAATPDEVRSIVQSELATLVLAPRA